MNSNERLSQIETAWSIVRRAHDSDVDSGLAKEQLLEQYGSAIRRYLLGAVRNESLADDLYQDFAVRFVSGDFYRASPDKGRFRNFLKTTLFRLVADHYRGQRRGALPLDQDLPQPDDRDENEEREQRFTQVWRDEMLKRSWNALSAAEARSGKPWFTLMQLRVRQPEMRSVELANVVSKELGRQVSPANVRVMLHRAREVFSSLLIDSIADSLNTACFDEIEEELAELQLLEYCQAALDQRRRKPSDASE